MKLYDCHLAPNPRRVRIFMAEKGVTCEKIEINIVKGENLDEDYLAVNPRGLVPTLVLDDGASIDEVPAICRYLEAVHPAPPLMGTDPVGMARIAARERHMEFDGMWAAAEVFRNSFPGFAERGVPGLGAGFAAIPELAQRGAVRLQIFYDRLNRALGDCQFVAGDGFTFADITALCAVDFAVSAARKPIPEDCKHLQRWHEAVSTRPSASA